jgi:hypothetical protein
MVTMGEQMAAAFFKCATTPDAFSCEILFLARSPRHTAIPARRRSKHLRRARMGSGQPSRTLMMTVIMTMETCRTGFTRWAVN